MAFEIPTDLINQVQLLLRKEAKLSSYDPDDSSLPNLPSSKDAIAELDPSPPYLRCKHCKGRFLRGVQSVICVFCAGEQNSELPPEPINFRSTIGCRWLLESLQLNESEMVGPSIETNESNRGQSAGKDEFPLSDLLDIEIRWPCESERAEALPSKSLLNLAGVELDSFFSEVKNESTTHPSEELSAPNKTIDSRESNSNRDDLVLSFFESVRPSEKATQGTEQKTNDSFSSWEPNFQFAGTEWKAPEHKSIVEDEDSFDAWNDFTSSTNIQCPSSSSGQQTFDQSVPSVGTADLDLFSSGTTSKDIDFGSFSQPDFFAGGSNNVTVSSEAVTTQTEASDSYRVATLMEESVTEEGAAKQEEGFADASSNSEDVKMLISQMHDLSFMLNSDLSNSPKVRWF